MSKVDVFNHGWIDLVFEGRNQEYGAYQLRKQDPKTTMIALFSGIAFLGAASLLPMLINHFSTAQATITPLPEPSVVELSDEHLFDTPKKLPEEKVETPTVASAAPAPPANNVVKLKNELVATTNPVTAPPNMEQLRQADPGQENIQGAGTQGSITNTTTTGIIGSTGVTAVTTPDTGDGIETFVDETPQFPGGIKSFLEKVGRNFNVPASDEVQTVRVMVWFIVERDGSISDIKVTRDPKPELGLGKEAIKALQRIKTKWEPGKKAGKAVRTAYSLPILVNIN